MSYDLNGELIEGFERDDCMLIGIYSSYEKAAAAIERASVLPGFKDYSDHFLIGHHVLDSDNWTSGFVES